MEKIVFDHKKNNYYVEDISFDEVMGSANNANPLKRAVFYDNIKKLY